MLQVEMERSWMVVRPEVTVETLEKLVKLGRKVKLVIVEMQEEKVVEADRSQAHRPVPSLKIHHQSPPLLVHQDHHSLGHRHHCHTLSAVKSLLVILERFYR